jgi:hypothetical protein
VDHFHKEENHVYYENTICYGYQIINDLPSFLHYYSYIKSICELVSG